MALFSYNQVEYIREAIEGAFSQTYNNLEIIISDDCSTDETFRVIQTLADAYVGPHKVIVRQTPKNIGTFLHVLDVINITNGGLIILASGDDVSKANRAAVLADEWRKSGAWGLHSTFDNIDENGNVWRSSYRERALMSADEPLRKYFNLEGDNIDIVHGCTSAYDRRLFEYVYTSNQHYILSEDGALSLLINLLNKPIMFVDRSLVRYRSHSGSMTNRQNTMSKQKISEIYLDIKKSSDYDRSCINRSKLLFEWNETIDINDKRTLNYEYIKDDVARLSVRQNWFEQNFRTRLRHLFDPKLRNDIQWMMPRLFGKSAFVFTKFVKMNIKYFTKH